MVDFPLLKMLFSRNVHESLVAAMSRAGVQPIWLYPPFDELVNAHQGVTPEQLADALRQHPDIRVVVLTSPDYYGVACHLRSIAAVAEERGIPLMVDQGYGASLPGHPEVPPSGLKSAALGVDGFPPASAFTMRSGPAE